MPFVPFVPAARPKPTHAPNLKLLYVEDEDTNWELTANELSRDFTVVRARNAREAFEQINREKFQLVLMDIQLSGSDLDGIQITQIWRGKFDGIMPDYARKTRQVEEPIVFVTAYSARYNKAALVAAGGDEMTTKPVSFTTLKLLLSRLLMRSAAQASASAATR